MFDYREILGTPNMKNMTADTLPTEDVRIPLDQNSETWSDRQEILKEVDPVINVVPAFPLRECSDWKPILDAVDIY